MIVKRAFKASDVLSLVDIREKTARDAMEQNARDQEGKGPSVTFICGEEVVASGGLRDVVPGVASAWVFLSVNASICAIVEVKRQLYSWIDEYRLRRVQAMVLSSWAKGNRFLEWLGMSFEGTMKKMAPDGSDMNLWAVTRG